MDLNKLELAQSKLLLLYIVKGADNLFNDEKLTKFVLELDLLNFFYFKQYIEELIESNFLCLDSNDNYHITTEGLNTLDMFLDKLPKDILEHINTNLNECKRDIISKKSIVSEYYKDDFNRFYVNLVIKEALVDIFNLHLEVPTEDYAQMITKSFEEEPDEFYFKIIKIFDV